ncbi:MAG: hypothetical protein IPK19_24425 [Chloroflexi bacterium]|nr:hypothetical protein [Chloroflexota bacterium]
MKRLVMLVLLALALTTGGVLAQEVAGHVETLDITWPPPVTEVWGVGDVLGTANVPNMVYYYLEYKALNDDLSEPQNGPWLPVTIALTSPVTDGVLATLDTRTVADGLYILRLTAATQDGQVFHDTVTPIRVDNARFQAVEARIRAEAGVTGTATQLPSATPVDTTPQVTPSSTAPEHFAAAIWWTTIAARSSDSSRRALMRSSRDGIPPIRSIRCASPPGCPGGHPVLWCWRLAIPVMFRL